MKPVCLFLATHRCPNGLVKAAQLACESEVVKTAAQIKGWEFKIDENGNTGWYKVGMFAEWEVAKNLYPFLEGIRAEIEKGLSNEAER